MLNNPHCPLVHVSRCPTCPTPGTVGHLGQRGTTILSDKAVVPVGQPPPVGQGQLSHYSHVRKGEFTTLICAEEASFASVLAVV